jgi:hypothetical protein
MATGSANVKTIVTPSLVSDTYKTSTYTYTLTASNVGPYGRVWDSRSGMSHQVTVHSKPQTPASLTIKGTGKSRTLICQMPAAITDANLADRQYYLVFGYVVGSEHLDFASQLQNNTSQLRWNKQFYTVGQMNNAYVYSVFKSGNVEIASGKRYLTSVDEAWDGSTYNGTTRSVIANETTGVDDVFAVEDAGTCKRVLTLDGKFVANTTEGLVPGVYLVQYENQDGELTTKKIIVK